MKIKLIGKDASRIETIRQALATPEGENEISSGIGSSEDIGAYINGVVPDLLIVDGASGKTLDAIESLSVRKPGIDAILISADTSPDFLMQAMRVGVREVVPAPGTPEVLQTAFARMLQKRGVRAPAGDGRVFAFLSCKGGSGATFIASNFAYAVAAEQGKRVALIDLNLQFGDAALYVSEQRPVSNVAEVARQIHRLDGSMLASSMLNVLPTFGVLAAPEDPAQAGDVQRNHVEAILRMARSRYDVVVLDIPRSLDAVSLQALDMAEAIFPVLQLALPHVRDAKRLAGVFRSLDYSRDKMRFVVNRYEKGGEISLDDLERTIGSPVFRTIPNSFAAVVGSVNLGVPLIKRQRTNPVSKALIEMAQELVPAAEQSSAGGGWLSRMFGAR